MSQWDIYNGTPEKPHSENERLTSAPPPWRDFRAGDVGDRRGQTYVPSAAEVRLVNAALHLRRPLLVTGPPGSGKSSLAYAIAEELDLKPVLKWPINSRTTLNDGLYHYDAISRLRDATLEREGKGEGVDSSDISRYLRLAPLGTALSSERPRVLLIDEIDKADIDLPNDLLHILEDGSFVIPELQRLSDEAGAIAIPGCERNAQSIRIQNGFVQCKTFPIIVMTSNGERDLPLAFHRRCLRLEVREPGPKDLEKIVVSHLGKLMDEGSAGKLTKLVEDFIKLRESGNVMATDQLLNLAFLLLCGKDTPGLAQQNALKELIFVGLNK